MATGKSSELHAFEGRDVIGTVVALTNTGDGLSKAVTVRSVEIKHGEKVYLVVEAEADAIRFDRSKDDPSKLIRKQILRGGTIAIVDFALVSAVLDAQEKANDKAAGRAAIPFEKDVSNPADWETPERTPGGEPAAIGDLAKQAAKKVAAKRQAKPKGGAST